jgi:glycine C-acetyltransferase
MDALREGLASAPRDARKLVVTDGVFSMEGDLAKLPEIVELAREHDAVVVVDDSHGVGVLGETGRGTVEHYGLLGEVDVITGTLGKALGGAAGGYVASSEEVCDLLGQRSRPQLFSNALPPTVACSALRAVEVMLEQPELLARLRERTGAFREMLAEAGYRPLDGEAAIVPIIVGETAEAIALSAQLLDEGVFVTGFGFPVVPEGTARIRVQMSAALEPEHLERAIDAFRRVRAD